jgi:hypothetical protein
MEPRYLVTIRTRSGYSSDDYAETPYVEAQGDNLGHVMANALRASDPARYTQIIAEMLCFMRDWEIFSGNEPPAVEEALGDLLVAAQKIADTWNEHDEKFNKRRPVE